jgi:hypothetical protein
MKLLGLRTTIYPAGDLERSKRWFESLLEIEPYFDQPFYVGFNVAGYELGLDPDADPSKGPISYWGVADAAVALSDLLRAGAREHLSVREVGEGIRVASVFEPGGGIFAVIENPHFVADSVLEEDLGPGR